MRFLHNLPVRIGVALFLLLWHTLAAAVSVTDDGGQVVTLPRPAQRIVSLAPHLTEILFAVGAGGRVVGAVQYSDYPPEAKKLPRIGGYQQVDLETVIGLRPDLIVAWQSGNNAGQIAQLKQLGFPVYLSEPRRITDVASSMERIAALAGGGEQAARALRDFRSRYARLQAQYARRSPVRTFYEVWNRPLMTVNGAHLIGDVMKLCGAQNVFADLPLLTPTVSEEAVLVADPEVIIASGMDEARPEWLDEWRRWPRMKAVQAGRLYFVPPDILQRHSPRILDGAEQLCLLVDRARRTAGAK
ncbi:cobalamin-binding protein [Sulfurimicrobium lacus]|uniref:Cobalamin-binding protein n=1 Tax=Sulfurimicrobium lacus TaxID=2715678 RepID=A0A6F8VGA8_9PROT|nr:cobalamin-binding protein [Sulfurimicrobium lacus]BCB28056.1 cobalamin-binding protein [Sulfurimicrobium lacus]